MTLKDLHETAKNRLEEWSKTLIAEDGARTTSQKLYGDYNAWIINRGWKPIALPLWGRWMGQRYAKTKHRGLTAYCEITIRREEG